MLRILPKHFLLCFEDERIHIGGIRMAFPRKEKQVSDFVAARKIDEKISFVRNDHEVSGIIFKILENSVIVEISLKDAEKIGAASNLTVVSHKNYSII
jgi:uncharacterized protein YkvS